MPLYEYQCDACQYRFEVIQKFSDPPVAACPNCQGSVKKLISSPAIQFKGAGWYITDYARKGQTEGTKAAPAKEGSTGSATSESAKSGDAGTGKSEGTSGGNSS
jgi:putative FmdB family regulatory protein